MGYLKMSEVENCMRSEREIEEKIAEIEAANRKRRKPNPERTDIINGLKMLREKGKYATLHDWEEKKRKLKWMEREKENGRHKYCKYGEYGEIIPGNEMDSICWNIAAYSWGMKIRDPEEMKLRMFLWNKGKRKEAIRD